MVEKGYLVVGRIAHELRLGSLPLPPVGALHKAVHILGCQAKPAQVLGRQEVHHGLPQLWRQLLQWKRLKAPQQWLWAVNAG